MPSIAACCDAPNATNGASSRSSSVPGSGSRSEPVANRRNAARRSGGQRASTAHSADPTTLPASASSSASAATRNTERRSVGPPPLPPADVTAAAAASPPPSSTAERAAASMHQAWRSRTSMPDWKPSASARACHSTSPTSRLAAAAAAYASPDVSAGSPSISASAASCSRGSDAPRATLAAASGSYHRSASSDGLYTSTPTSSCSHNGGARRTASGQRFSTLADRSHPAKRYASRNCAAGCSAALYQKQPAERL
mmetsp:Transcript_8523/g.25815  ORF Transcript_8523/g.25815 Transcript_8523/m.25815 type:complete len:255 (-) Transcript_8523:336-1100(-)